MSQLTDNTYLIEDDKNDLDQKDEVDLKDGMSDVKGNDVKESVNTIKKVVTPKHPLPPTKLSIDNQLSVLSFYAALSNGGSESVTVNSVSDISGKASATLSSFNSFYKDIRLLRTNEGARGFYPCEELLDYANQLSSNPNSDNAVYVLQPVIHKTWFGKLITQFVNTGQKPNDAVLLSKLAIFVGVAQKGREGQLAQLIEWCVKTGLIEKQSDGTYLSGRIQNSQHEQKPPQKNSVEGDKSKQREVGGYDELLLALNNVTFGLKEIRILKDEGVTKYLLAVKNIEEVILKLKDGECQVNEQ